VASLVIVVSVNLVLYPADRHTQICTQTDANERFTPASLVGVNNEKTIEVLQLRYAYFYRSLN